MIDNPKDPSYSSVLIVESGYARDLWRTVHISTCQGKNKSTTISINLKGTGFGNYNSEINTTIEVSADEASELASLLREAAEHVKKIKEIND